MNIINGGIYSFDKAKIIFIGLGDEKVLNELRFYINRLESYSTELNDFVFAENFLSDQGNNSCEMIKELKRKDKVLLVASTDHYNLYRTLKYYGRVDNLIVFDSHLDLRDRFKGKKETRECTIRRIIEDKLVKHIFYYGVRSYSKEEIEFLTKNRESINIIKDKDEFLDILDKNLINGNICVSIDVDVLEPIYCPNTSYPEINGINFYELLSMVEKTIEKLSSRIKIIDVAEIGNGSIDLIYSANLIYKICEFFRKFS